MASAGEISNRFGKAGWYADSCDRRLRPGSGEGYFERREITGPRSRNPRIMRRPARTAKFCREPRPSAPPLHFALLYVIKYSMIQREMKEPPPLGPGHFEIQPRSALLINPFYPKDPNASFGKHVLTPTL